MTPTRNITLEKYFEMQLGNIKELLETKFNAIEQSTKLATETLNARLESMNEFRGAMKDQMANAFTKPEQNFYAEKVSAEIKSLELSRATLEGKASQKSVTYAILISVIGALFGMAGFILKLVK